MFESSVLRVLGFIGTSVGVLAAMPGRLPADIIVATDAYAAVSGGTVSPYTFNDDDEGIDSANAIGAVNVNGASASAVAQSYFGPAGDFEPAGAPILSAFVRAISPAADAFPNAYLWRSGADALATWYDEVRLTGPITQDWQSHIRMTLEPKLDGVVSGDAFAEYFVSAGSGASSASYHYRQWDNGAGRGESSSGSYPLKFDVTLRPDPNNPGTFVSDVIIQSWKLHAFAQSAYWEPESHADYAHTLTLAPILITDVNGNHIPASENWQIIGSSGLIYATQVPLPEPGSLTLVALGIVGIAVSRFRRGKNKGSEVKAKERN